MRKILTGLMGLVLLFPGCKLDNKTETIEKIVNSDRACCVKVYDSHGNETELRKIPIGQEYFIDVYDNETIEKSTSVRRYILNETGQVYAVLKSEGKDFKDRIWQPVDFGK